MVTMSSYQIFIQYLTRFGLYCYSDAQIFHGILTVLIFGGIWSIFPILLLLGAYKVRIIKTINKVLISTALKRSFFFSVYRATGFCA